MRHAIRNAVFACVVLAILAGPTALWAASHVPGAQLPSWLTTEDATYLSGSRQPADVRAQATCEGYLSKSLQGAIEAGVGNFIPLKAKALLANASLQRAFIAGANAPFAWECYPTYFGSDVTYIPAQDALAHIPKKAAHEQRDELASLAQAYSDFARRHADKRFVLYLVQGEASLAANPSLGLVSGAIESREVVRIFEDAAAGVDNLWVLTCTYDKPDAYYRDFFRTDQHWNIYGAARAYNVVADALKLAPVADVRTGRIGHSGELQDADDGYRFTGSVARGGLFAISEDAFDADIDFSQVTVTKIDGTVGDGNDHEAFEIYPEQGKTYVFHSHYYDNLTDCTTTAAGTGAALLIGDSYRGVIQRLIMAQYQRLSASSDLHHEIIPSHTLDELIAETGADDVIMVATPADYLILHSQNPRYLE